MPLRLLLELPVLVKVLGTLALILLANRLMRNLLASVLAGTLLLAFWLGHGLPAIGAIAWRRFSELDNFLMIVVMLQVMWLGSLMAASGVMRELVEAVRRRVPHRLSFAALPAVIGLLPMPGGALFSAPMVESCDGERRLSGLLKSLTNHWFRHIWEYWWPLYPGVILALELTRLSIGTFVLAQFPLTLIAVACGYLLFLRRIPRDEPAFEPSVAATRQRILSLMAPILTVVGAFALIQLLVPAVQRVSRYIPMAAGLCLALIVLQIQRRLPLSAWRQAILSSRDLQLALLVAVIRIYSAYIEAPLPTGPLPVEMMRQELALFGIPSAVLLVTLPFICGFTMGSTVGMLGASFPIALSLLGPNPELGKLLATTVLCYGFGYMGEMLSPVHVCLVASSEYFQTRLARNLAGLLPPVLLMLAGVTLWQFALGWLPPGWTGSGR